MSGTNASLGEIALSRSFAVVDDAAGLVRILRPALNVCVWRRALPGDLQTWLDGLCRSLSLDAAAQISPEPSSVRRLFATVPNSPEAEAWLADVVLLATLYGELVGKTSIRASLVSVTTDKCKKLHADYKPLRLVCTYAGPGTEWVDDRFVDRAELGRPDPCVDAANARIVRRAAGIQRASAGDVVLLKGERFVGNVGRGAVHRSPRIERAGARRLVLTLDEA